ncbi:MAG: ATP synthase F1 subunit epsilon [Deltaproteobacteria bacterium]|nr:ATP synthase F1 subunit epsilon [Deltaproteobacteria bacterium]
MAENTFTLRILTPAGQAVQEEVSEVYLPSSRGEIGILPHHAKYTGLLGTGVLSYVRAGSTLLTRIVISEGFCSFAQGELNVLADAVDIAENVDRQSVLQSKQEALKAFEENDPTDPRWQFARIRLARYEALDTLISH